jgi:uncharacterized membrane protein YcaP (DUF421 family)
MIVSDISGLVRILIIGPLAYIILIAVLRISGKRTLAKMNAFDFIVTVALGSTLATVLLSKDVPLAEGVLGFTLLAALQFIIAWTAQRSPLVAGAIKSQARVLLRNGIVDQQALLDERVTDEEVRSAIRKAGIGDVAMIAVVLLETDGSFSVISLDKVGDRSAMPGGRQSHREP